MIIHGVNSCFLSVDAPLGEELVDVIPPLYLCLLVLNKTFFYLGGYLFMLLPEKFAHLAHLGHRTVAEEKFHLFKCALVQVMKADFVVM